MVTHGTDNAYKCIKDIIYTTTEILQEKKRIKELSSRLQDFFKRNYQRLKFRSTQE